MTTEQIQLHVLAQAVKGRDVFRREVAKALKVSPKEVDASMARCGLVKRVTANGGAHVRYRLAY